MASAKKCSSSSSPSSFIASLSSTCSLLKYIFTMKKIRQKNKNENCFLINNLSTESQHVDMCKFFSDEREKQAWIEKYIFCSVFILNFVVISWYIKFLKLFTWNCVSADTVGACRLFNYFSMLLLIYEKFWWNFSSFFDSLKHDFFFLLFARENLQNICDFYVNKIDDRRCWNIRV